MRKQTPPFGLRMPFELHDWVKVAAKEQSRSMNNFIVRVLEKEMDALAQTGKPPEETKNVTS